MMTQTDLEIQEHTEDQDYMIRAVGDLIITNARVLQKHIDTALNQGASNVTINLREIQYIDSFGIGVIIKTKSDLDKKQGILRVLVNPTLYALFEKCHLDDYINLVLIENTPKS
jgi:anti-anti-sigma factor